jgi:thiamine pyrophosphate-dependent acetolactate synthase large subunit-like protein
MAEVTGGEVVVRTLQAHDVDVVFGLPGVHALAIYDALYAHPELKHITVRHEQTAAYMADGYARVTGRPGVCITTTGPGAANTAAAMGTAYFDSVAILNVMSQVASNLVDRDKGALHEPKDQLGFFRAVTKWNARASGIERIPAVLHQAFRTMLVERPRPTQVEVCTDHLAGKVDSEAVPWLTAPQSFPLRAAEPALVEEAAHALASAEAPIIWAGGGVNRAGAWEELARLAEALQAPVVTTIQGLGAIPYDHPLALGYRPYDRTLTPLVERSDLLLAVGTRFAAGQTANWNLKLPARLIHIDVDETEVDKSYPATLGLIGDARLVLGQLLEALSSHRATACWAGDVAALRSQMADNFKAAGPHEMAVLDDIRQAVDRDAIIVCDQTKPAYWAARSFPVYEPRTFLYPGYGTLGYGFPTALGVKVGMPGRQVVCIAGDGGFQYALPELATAAQFGINVTVLLFNDSGYGILRVLQDMDFQSHYYAVDLLNPDFGRLTEAYGLRHIGLNAADGLGPALRRALESDRTTVIEVPVDFGRPTAWPMPPPRPAGKPQRRGKGRS